jgi:hypothetical protein
MVPHNFRVVSIGIFKRANALDVEMLSQCGFKTSIVIYHHQNQSLKNKVHSHVHFESLSC